MLSDFCVLHEMFYLQISILITYLQTVKHNEPCSTQWISCWINYVLGYYCIKGDRNMAKNAAKVR